MHDLRETAERAAAINPALAATETPPVMAARAWIAGKTFPAERPLLNLSQAAPTEPPPEPLRRAMARWVLEDADIHLYGPVLGEPALRAEIAERWSSAYAGAVRPADVAITAGCNQAFCAAAALVAGAGDRMILPSPWYFNHKMWLDMAGVGVDPLPCDMAAGGSPDPDACAALIGPRTRAIVLVTPNNPTGAEYPPALIRAFYDLARRAGVALILDETYRDFHSVDGPPHDLFAQPDWRETLIHLYSFSKTFRLTGHRVGALLTAPDRLAEIEKFLDSMTICPPKLGQAAALEGLRTLGDWVAAERREILARKARLLTEAARLPEGWRVLSAGAYFAFLAHPFDAPSDQVARGLVEAAHLLCLPGTMFAPAAAEGGDGWAERTVRLAFANADGAGIAEAIDRIAAVTPDQIDA